MVPDLCQWLFLQHDRQWICVYAREKESGWELVGVFATNDDMALVTDSYELPNHTVFGSPLLLSLVPRTLGRTKDHRLGFLT